MKRKVILIFGNGGTAFDEKNAATFANKLQQKDNVDLSVVGNGERDINIHEIVDALYTVEKEQQVTIIIQSHSEEWIEGLRFSFGDDFCISSNKLFLIIKNVLGENKPVDIFSPTCYGARMMHDKDVLPRGSVLASLTSYNMVNVGTSYNEMIKNFEQFTGEVTTYNLLEFYLLTSLINRIGCFIAVSGSKEIYDLNSFLSEGNARDITFDNNHFDSLGRPAKYLEVYNKIKNLLHEYQINLSEYGIAQDIILNNLKTKGLIPETSQPSEGVVIK